MDFVIDDARSFLAAMMYIRMFGELISMHTSNTTGAIMRTYKYGNYFVDIGNFGSYLGIELSIQDFKKRITYDYHNVTDKNLIGIFEEPESKLVIKEY